MELILAFIYTLLTFLKAAKIKSIRGLSSVDFHYEEAIPATRLTGQFARSSESKNK